VGEVGDRAVSREGPPVAAGELAGVQRGCEDLAFGDSRLDAAADEARIERVVAGVKSL
jgi:hypothetical protein